MKMMTQLALPASMLAVALAVQAFQPASGSPTQGTLACGETNSTYLACGGTNGLQFACGDTNLPVLACGGTNLTTFASTRL